ncbi:Uncharacterised protein [Bordetella pertussis]|nr:Uncharacterised protein [Bordetella pertussis]CFL91574.1 Uncharacterised protein [Bordetella pertussis]CFN06530.1 Uncharacterised protein [Bordetella pertussis]CFN61085.1 Uncharacterised protein [Bordetella pertussis]CFN95173.1 Uncharacterised protein [Bordetella pertussis]
MRAEPFGNQRHAYHHQEGQRQHDHGRIAFDEARQRLGRQQHDGHRDDHRHEHDGNVLGHAHGGDDAVDREHQIQHQDLRHRRGKAERGGLAAEHVVARVGIDMVVDFLGGLPHQEQAAGHQDDVAPRKPVAEQFEHRLRQLHDERHRAQQRQPQDQRHADPDAPRLGLVLGRQLVGEYGDEYEVVDAQHDFHGDEGSQGCPGGGLLGQRNKIVHRRLQRRRVCRS